LGHIRKIIIRKRKGAKKVRRLGRSEGRASDFFKSSEEGLQEGGKKRKRNY